MEPMGGDMKESLGKLTLRGVEGGKAPPPRLFADGRYLLSGSPRVGGLATVYRALDVGADTHVALKVFRPVGGTDDVVEESFRREVQALSGLKHDNIVRILGSGFDASSGEHFISMEWIPQDLETIKHGKRFSEWKDFYENVGQYVLQALAFAHANAVVHRDIKPSNILITDEAVVRVCDFGISKIRNFLEPGVTLAHFASIPYAPPEPDDGSYSYSRDVFGFAALSVSMVHKSLVNTHSELVRAVDGLPADDAVRRILRRSLSLDNPAERPENAAVLLAELERMQPKREEPKRGVILISLTKNVRDIISYDLGATTDHAVEAFVLSDLREPSCQYDSPPRDASGERAERSIRIYGERYGYIAVRDGADGNTLKLVSASDPPIAELERYRENSQPCSFEFAYSGSGRLHSAAHITELRLQLESFASEQKVLAIHNAQQEIYRTWLNLLSAKTELENSRRRIFRYEEMRVAGAVIEFKLAPGSDMQALDDKDIRIDCAEGEFLGSVIASELDVLRVQASERNRIEATALPRVGTLSIDTSKADAALDRQKTAVDAVRYGRSINPSLGEYIVDPSVVPVAQEKELVFVQSQIDEDKKDAVRMAAGEPALMIVEGPPGTGKTTFITELVLQTLQMNPTARILLTSQTHVALDNSLERISKESDGSIRAVRIGHDGDERISQFAREMLVDRKLPLMRREAISQGREFIEGWAAKQGVDLENTRMAMALGRHAGLRERLEHVVTLVKELRPIIEGGQESLSAEERVDLEDQLGGLIKEQEALDRDLLESLAEVRKYERDKETVQHLAECTALELRSWADTYAPQTADGTQLRKMLAVHSDWETRFGRSREFKAALIASSQVVAGTCLGVMSVPGRNEIDYDLCIVDEASIATPTEVLVPMSRARRTVLVGDNKQLSPFQDPELKSKGLLKKYNIDQREQAVTLFRHLTELLPPALRKSLTSQHRMLPAIGNLISECFYGESLRSIERPPDPLLAAALPKAVVWRSTSRLQNRGSKTVGTSHYNNLEIELVERLLVKIDFDIQQGKWKGEQRSVAVLTGYGEQKRRLQRAIDTRRHAWSSFSSIFVNVVDAFQGREADFAIFSVTRSDVSGLGFLREMERINVALSRARERLIIIGDHSYCQQASDRENPLKEVIDYIRRNPADCAIEEVQP